MKNKTTKYRQIFALLVLAFTTTFVSYANSDPQEGGIVDTKSKVEAYILHHIKDSHDFSLFSYSDSEGERHHFGFPLPVIVKTSSDLISFMSSAFHHDDNGQVVVEKDGLNLVKLHGKIYELSEGATEVAFDEAHHPTNATQTLDLSITKSVMGILMIGIFLILAFSSLAKQYRTKQVPTGFGRLLEPLVLYVRDEIAKPNIGEKNTESLQDTY